MHRLWHSPQRHWHTLQSIPVVAVSADATAEQEERLRRAGAHAYLVKPLDVCALLRVVDSVVSGAASLAPLCPTLSAEQAPQLHERVTPAFNVCAAIRLVRGMA